MTYGTLTVICGPMFSSKSTSLLKRILWERNGLEKDVLVVKPAFDNRYSETRIVTHDGLSVNAQSITGWLQVARKADFADSIFLDEAQFFDGERFSDDIIKIVKGLLGSGKNVIANGLDMDIMGDAFPITATLMAMADEVIKLTSNCSVCGQPATKSFKLIENGKSVELGSVGMYEPRCNRHWTLNGSAAS